MRPWSHTFYFVPSDSNLYPSESVVMTHAEPAPVEGKKPSLTWALDFIAANPTMWMVVPLKAKKEDDQRNECKVVRSVIWKQGLTRDGMGLTSQWWDGRLWVRAIAK